MTEGKERDEAPEKNGLLRSKMVLILGLLVLFAAFGTLDYAKFIKPVKSRGTNAGKQSNNLNTKRIAVWNPMPLKPFLVNLYDRNNRRYMEIRFVLNLSDKSLEKEINNKLPDIRDSILMLLMAKTYDEVASPIGKKTLKKEIIKTINHHLQSGSIREVFITELLLG